MALKGKSMTTRYAAIRCVSQAAPLPTSEQPIKPLTNYHVAQCPPGDAATKNRRANKNKMQTLEQTEQSKEETARQCLHAQKEAHEKSLRESGSTAGRRFVLNTGEDDGVYEQMTALDRYNEHHDSPEALAGLIAAMDATDTVLMDWFREMYQRDAEEPAWLEGFVAGALEKFHELVP